MDFGAITLAIAVLGVIGWLTFLVTQSRVRRRREPAPQNLSPFMTDDELESKRLNRILVSALISTAVLAIVMPIYYLNEADRQVHAAEVFDEIAVERGEHWFEEFQCGDCHGVDGGRRWRQLRRSAKWDPGCVGGSTPQRHPLSLRRGRGPLLDRLGQAGIPDAGVGH